MSMSNEELRAWLRYLEWYESGGWTLGPQMSMDQLLTAYASQRSEKGA